ncbi:UDP-glucuronosyltransferase 1-2 [Lingula anatina]|nr:UDP-glucuronosyltransferase 1-2 [Lingula anatina]|eukprot:XP_013384650.1 UDP-glucuronosyltransferase 1-2 [Lingula anatina]
MMPYPLYVVVWVALLHGRSACLGAKIFMLPYTQVFNSRTLNMEKIARLLTDRGHSVTMMVADHYKPRTNIDGVSLVRFETPKLEVNKAGELALDTTMSSVYEGLEKMMAAMDEMEEAFCHFLLRNETRLQELKATNFSLFLFDLVNLGSGPVLNDFLEIPSIAYSNLGFWDPWHVFRQPVFKSFTPAIPGGYSDHMTFWERLHNVDIENEVNDWLDKKIERTDAMVLEYFPKKPWPPMKRAFERVSLMIAANVDFALDYPRPVMPHVKPISGLLWTPPKPLPKFYQDLMASGRHGVVVMSFGTLVAELTEGMAEGIAKVFARLPQTVIWRYKGPVPKSLGKNTHLVDWFPQNDILSHPATKLFITHCGISSTWETLYHAVPVVAVPLIWDQHQNARKLTDRCNIGVSLSFLTFTEADFESAIQTVLNNRTYKDNAVKMSELLKDQPMSGQDQLLFWINYVIRHNGTLHFHSQASYNLNWCQYFLVDIIAYKIAVKCLHYIFVLVCAIMFWKLLKYTWFLYSKQKKKTV